MPAAAAVSGPDVERLPYPIAHLYRDMVQEEDPRIKFRALIKVFAGCVKYMAILCIAEYAESPECNEVNSALADSLRRPSLGHWLSFLRSIAEHYKKEGREFHVKELKGVLGHHRNLFDHLVHLRNEYVHPDVLPKREESQALFDETLPHLRAIISDVAFLADYPLIRRRLDSGREVATMGSEVDDSGPDAVRFLVRSSDRDLDVTPFMLLDVDSSFRHLLVYETLLGKKGNTAKYIMGDDVRFVEIGDEPDNRVVLLRAVLAKFATDEGERQEEERVEARRELANALSTKDIPLQPLRTLARSHSDQVFEEYKADGRYDPATYVERRGMRLAYDQLLDGESNALVIAADSGVGKSTEICHLYLQRLQNDIVWILSGRTTRAGSILSEIARYLLEEGERSASDLSALLAAFAVRRKGERFVILFDGLNETDQPLDVFRELNEFLEANKYPWLKVIITCRSYAWSLIESSTCALIDTRLYVASEGGGLAVELHPFDDEELHQALEKYSGVFDAPWPRRWLGDGGGYREGKLLRSPLILRFVFEAFRGRQDMPAILDLDSVMGEFTKRRIRERDLQFLQTHLMAFFYSRETDRLDTAALLDAVREMGRLPQRPAEAEAYEKLVEHICGEQIYDVDEVWLCTDRSCVHHTRPTLVSSDGVTTNPRCEVCRSLLRRENVDNRSTYARLLGENVLSQAEVNGEIVVRLVFDRYFDYLMKKYFLAERMSDGSEPEAVAQLFEKAKRNGIFVDPLRAILQELWQRGRHDPLYRIAATGDFASYHVVREFFEALALSDFERLESALRVAVKETAFNVTICRAGVHALLIDPELARQHSDAIVDLVLFLAQCSSEQVHEEGCEYLLELRSRDIDLITPLIERSGAQILAAVSLGSAMRLAASRATRERLKGIVTLYLNLVLFGLGKFFEDEEIQGAVVRTGLAVVQRILRHPVLALLHRQIARFVSNAITKIYKEKGPLPCNYWEMLFQLRHGPDDIRRSGDLFFVEKQNVFDLDYGAFKAAVHSENGLVSWYLMSLLPVHFGQVAAKERAIDYLSQLAREGTEMDRYVVGEAVAMLLHGQEKGNDRLRDVLLEIGRCHLADPSQIFLHPAPEQSVPEVGYVLEFNREQVAKIRKASNPFMLPWIREEGGLLQRFYINSVVFHVALAQMQENKAESFTELLDILKKNCESDILRFGGDVGAARKLVANLLIQALSLAAAFGFLREAFRTLDAIIWTYIEKREDPVNIEVYRYALVETLKSIKEYHRDAVLSFVDGYDPGRADYEFLADVRSASVEKEKLFSKSLYGNNIYQGGFSGRTLREAFGEFTIRAASARSVEEFFYIYTLSFVRWLKNYSA